MTDFPNGVIKYVWSWPKSRRLITEMKHVLDPLMEMMDSALNQELNYERSVYVGQLYMMIQTFRVDILRGQSVNKTELRAFFVEVGGLCLSILLEDYSFEPEEFAEFLLSKHKMYGPGPFEHWGYVIIGVRLDSKICRLRNILESEDHGDEPPIDTLKDIIGYCILGQYL
jgi:hypothetical protein